MTPKFMEHIYIDIPKDLTPKFDEFGDMTVSAINQMIVQQVESIDDKICKEIHDMAVSNGIDDVYLLDKKQILSALEKQIPKNPIGIYDENIYHIDDDDYIYEPALFGICPVCNKEVQDGMLFCSFCGQALDWSDTE